MLPVAFEALSVRKPHAGKSANAKQDSGSPAPFTEMIDDLASKTDTSESAVSSTAADGDGSEVQPRATRRPLLAKSASLAKSPATAASPLNTQGISLSLADDADGENSEPGDRKDASKDAAEKIGPNSITVTLTGASAGKAKQNPSGDIGTELPVDIAGLIGATIKTDAQPNPAKQSDAHSGKATGGKNLDGATMTDQTGVCAETVTTGAELVTAAVATMVDPSVPTAAASNQAEPQAAISISPVTVAGKDAAPSPDMASGQPQTKAQSLGDGANGTASAGQFTLADLDSDEALELPATLLALAEAAATHGKDVQAGASPKLNAPVGSQPSANAEKPDAAATSEDQGLIPQTQAAAAAPASHAAQTIELDPQKTSLPQHDSLPQDTSAAPGNSHTLVASSTLSLNGITIAAPAGGPYDASSVGAIATTPQSAPAALVPISGIAVEIASKALAGKNRFEIRLDPPELGRIHIRLDVDRSGEISSHLVADRSDTLDLLRRDAPSLERALQDAGLKTSNNGLQFSLRDHGFARQEQPLPMPANARLIVSDEALPAETTPTAYRPLAGLRAGLDIRV